MTDAERFAAEMWSLLGFADGLGLDEAIVRLIYETVWWEAQEAGVGDDERMTEVRKRMLAAARGGLVPHSGAQREPRPSSARRRNCTG